MHRNCSEQGDEKSSVSSIGDNIITYIDKKKINTLLDSSFVYKGDSTINQ